MPKYFFFDVDGTLLPFGKGIPQSAISAIKAAQVLGNKVFIASGRSAKELPVIEGIDFDGYVLSAGSHVIVEGKELANTYFSDEEYSFLASYFKEHGLLGLYQTDEGTYLSAEALELFKRHFERYLDGMVELNGLIISDTLPKDSKVRKAVFICEEGGYGVTRTHEVLRPRFELVKNTVGLPYELMAEVGQKNITKATGIELVLRYYGADRRDAVAVGDGSNDLEMIEYAGLGIAMGNADEELKRKADFVTTDVEADGVKNAIFHALAKPFDERSLV